MPSGHTGDVEIRKADIDEHIQGLGRAVDQLERVQGSIDAMAAAVLRAYTTVVEPGIASTGNTYGDVLEVVCSRQRLGINAFGRAMANVRTVWSNLEEVDQAALRSVQGIQDRVEGLDRRLVVVESQLGMD